MIQWAEMDNSDYKQVIARAKVYAEQDEIKKQRMLKAADHINQEVDRLRSEDKLSANNARKMHTELYMRLLRGESLPESCFDA